MPKNKLKWRKDGTAKCGPFIVFAKQPLVNGGWWSGVKFEGHAFYLQLGKRLLKSEQSAKSAAESWLSRQVEKMRKDLGRK